MRARDISTGSQLLFTAQTDSPAYAGFLNFWSSLIIFQNIIPISLYVSIEFVKTFQAYFIWNDLDMWDIQSKKPCVPKTVNFLYFISIFFTNILIVDII